MPTTDDNERQQALKLVRHAAAKRREADLKLTHALMFGRDLGVSLRDLAEAAEIPHTTIADRLRAREKGEGATS